MNEAITLIHDYMDKHLFEPQIGWPKQVFMERSYSRWAAIEMLERIMDRPFDPPTTVIEDFLFEMAFYSQIEELSKSTCMFTVAEHTANDILYLILRKE